MVVLYKKWRPVVPVLALSSSFSMDLQWDFSRKYCICDLRSTYTGTLATNEAANTRSFIFDCSTLSIDMSLISHHIKTVEPSCAASPRLTHLGIWWLFWRF